MREKLPYEKEFGRKFDKERKNFYKISKVVVVDGVKEIYDRMFYQDEEIYEVELPDSVEKIGRAAFAGCINLEKINLPKGLKKIGEKAFSGVLGLSELVIPEGVKEINPNVFYKSSITTVYISEEITESFAMRLSEEERVMHVAPVNHGKEWYEYNIGDRNKMVSREIYTVDECGKVSYIKSEKYNKAKSTWTEIYKKGKKDKECSQIRSDKISSVKDCI